MQLTVEIEEERGSDGRETDSGGTAGNEEEEQP